MRGVGPMRRVWIGVTLGVALLSFYPAWTGLASWWMPGIAFALFLVFALEPWFLTWQLRRRGEELQITDEGVLRRLARANSEYVRWRDLREVSIVVTQGAVNGDDYFYVLAGSGATGVLVGQRLAVQHDLLAHLGKLPGFDHRSIAAAMTSLENRRFLLWRAAPLEGQAAPVHGALVADQAPAAPPRLH